MNIQLGSAEEWIDDKLAGKLGDLLIRCNNVLHLREMAGVVAAGEMSDVGIERGGGGSGETME